MIFNIRFGSWGLFCSSLAFLLVSAASLRAQDGVVTVVAAENFYGDIVRQPKTTSRIILAPAPLSRNISVAGQAPHPLRHMALLYWWGIALSTSQAGLRAGCAMVAQKAPPSGWADSPPKLPGPPA